MTSVYAYVTLTYTPVGCTPPFFLCMFTHLKSDKKGGWDSPELVRGTLMTIPLERRNPQRLNLVNPFPLRWQQGSKVK